MKHTPHPTSAPTTPSRERPRMLRRLLLLGCVAPIGLLAACGDKQPAADTAESSFCDQLSQSSALAESIDPLENSAQVADAFGRLAELAPAEIRADVQAVTDAMVTLVTTPTDDPTALSDAVDVLLSPEVTAATERIGHYAMDTCGITPSAWSQT